ncbi:energy-coupling factor ABC transporter ATP-binding protein [Sediminispirochaeta bajacaliforniensis]|uniref:energy-coupling factor ABC transporter ATP-binding protein n=1 Tax=Sediminispirochaeta bajacaliforniensis TaxID=148 RepID=UPI000365A404|nr:ATP-binding cassette domain-containing protein [Sediminispirochaeta bajacaliforniensis]
MKQMIKVEGLKIRHYRRDSHIDAVKEISFSVDEGEFISVCGLNGSGKTSLLSALNGLIPHFYKSRMKGRVTVAGLDTKEHTVAELSRSIGFVFDNPFNQISYTTETVRHEIAFGLCNLNIKPSVIEKQVEETAELVGITHLLDRSPLALSGGQLQRIAIASVIVMKPNIIMLDDCTSQLDPLGSQEIFKVIERLRSRGMTIICVDHDIERVCTYADKILLLSKGELKAYGTPRDVLSDPSMREYGLKTHDSYEIAKILYENGIKNAKGCLTYHDLKQGIAG